MGFNFSFFGKQEVRKFNYKPRFYDPETEERRKKYGDFSKPKEEKRAPGSYIKGSLRGGQYNQSKGISKNQKILGAVSLILLCVIIWFMFQYFPRLMSSLEANQETLEQVPVEDELQIVNID